MTADDNKAIYETRYGAASFRLGGDRYAQAMHAVRFELIERYGAGRDVLDIGCANGNYLKPMLPKLRSAIGLDYTQRFLDEFAASFDGGLPANLRLVCADARAMPLPDACVDFAWSFATLYTIPEVERVIGEVSRVLRPGGVAALEFGNVRSINTLVADAWHKAESWAKPYNLRLTDLARWLDGAGLDVIERRCFQLLPLYAIPRRLIWLRPLSGQPLRPWLARRTAGGRIMDEVISGSPILSRFAFRHLVIARRR